jgi:hypothetical protein
MASGYRPDNLGIRTFLNGQLTSNIVLNTSAAATDTIDYVAIDQSGLTSTSTRTVIIKSPPSAATTATDNGLFRGPKLGEARVGLI